MEKAKDPKEPLHPAAHKIVNERGRSGQLSNEFAKLLENSGLSSSPPAKDGAARTRPSLSFHSLRHTATSLLKAGGPPPSVVMAYIGHDSADVSHGYTHAGREALEKAAAAFRVL